jgi:hypothetical protein
MILLPTPIGLDGLAIKRGACFGFTTLDAAPAAVERIPANVDALTVAEGKTLSTHAACPAVTVRGVCGTDLATGAAVVGIPSNRNTCAITVVRSFDAGIDASAVNAGAVFVGAGFFTCIAAGSAVVAIVAKIRADIATGAVPA